MLASSHSFISRATAKLLCPLTDGDRRERAMCIVQGAVRLIVHENQCQESVQPSGHLLSFYPLLSSI